MCGDVSYLGKEESKRGVGRIVVSSAAQECGWVSYWRSVVLCLNPPLFPRSCFQKDCIDIVEACRASRVLLSVCHVLRYAPVNQLIKRLLDDGVIGELVNIQVWKGMCGQGKEGGGSAVVVQEGVYGQREEAVQ